MAAPTGLGLGACLADDMGLGKTLQILMLLLVEKMRRQEVKTPSLSPSLLVVPASLLGNWKREAEKFTPTLNLLFIHPSESEQVELSSIVDDPESHFRDVDLVVTTYSMLSRQKLFTTFSWNLAMTDGGIRRWKIKRQIELSASGRKKMSKCTNSSHRAR